LKDNTPLTLKNLADAFAKLQGIGPKTAQRISLHLLQHDRESASFLAESLTTALEKINNCNSCNNFCENEICMICSDTTRDDAKLCIVESPSDLLVLEQSHAFNGKYFVLMGKLSPLDGVGPKELKFENLVARFNDCKIKEVILATNFTPEGEATAHAIEIIIKDQKLVPSISITRLAKGVPHGAELEFTDLGTIAQALKERKIG
jgi:recombination protein RecR